MYHRSIWPALALMLVAALLCMKFTLYPAFLASMLCFAMLASAFNLLLGYAGLMSFGHAAFYGLGAYGAAYLSLNYSLTPEVIILAGGAAGALLGVLFGVVSIRRHGLFFAMITLALAQMVYFICAQIPALGRDDGLHGFRRGDLFGVLPMQNDEAFLWVVIAVYLAIILFIYRVVHSPFGNVLVAIRQNEDRAASLGYNPERYKFVVFVMSATIAGIAGSTKALALGFVGLNDLAFLTSGEIMLMTLVGGAGTMIGPSVGAWVLIAIGFYLSTFGNSIVMMINGAVFMLAVLFLRGGIVGTLAERLKLKL